MLVNNDQQSHVIKKPTWISNYEVIEIDQSNTHFSLFVLFVLKYIYFLI
jgi:hypothetical protein